MRVLVLGAGGVGGYLGYRLGRFGDAEVTFVARGAHLEAIRSGGLEVLDDSETFLFRPEHAVEDPSGLGIFDLILVAVKHTDLPESLEKIAANFAPDSVILPLLNGVEHRREILERYPEADVMEGCIYILSNILRPGVIRKKSSIFNLCWGREGFDPSDYAKIVDLFNRALPRHKATADIAYVQWKKFLFISPMAALTSRYGLTMDRIVADHREELRSLMEEIAVLARTKGIDLDEEIVNEILQRMEQTPPGAKTSMQLDLEAGKPAEIEALLGFVISEGQKMGISIPVMQKCYESLTSR